MLKKVINCKSVLLTLAVVCMLAACGNGSVVAGANLVVRDLSHGDVFGWISVSLYGLMLVLVANDDNF